MTFAQRPRRSRRSACARQRPRAATLRQGRKRPAHGHCFHEAAAALRCFTALRQFFRKGMHSGAPIIEAYGGRASPSVCVIAQRPTGRDFIAAMLQLLGGRQHRRRAPRLFPLLDDPSRLERLPEPTRDPLLSAPGFSSSLRRRTSHTRISRATVGRPGPSGSSAKLPAKFWRRGPGTHHQICEVELSSCRWMKYL